MQYNSDIQKFQCYKNGTFINNEIDNGSVLRIWDMNNSQVSNTVGLTDYWTHTLVWVNKDSHPYLIYGPYTSPSNVSSYEIQKILDITGGYTWAYLDTSVSSSPYQDETESLILGRCPHSVAYKIVAHLINGSPASSDSIAIKVNGGNLKQEGSGNKNSKLFNYTLNQNYPNPFNPSTTIQYSIKDPGLVKIELFDILRRRVRTLVNEVKQPGEYKVNINGHNLTSGIYLYRLISGTFTQVKKMQLLK